MSHENVYHLQGRTYWERMTPDATLVSQALRYEQAHPHAGTIVLDAEDEKHAEALRAMVWCMARAHKTRIRVEVLANKTENT